MNSDASATDRRDAVLKNLRRLGVYGSVIHTHRSMAAIKLPPARLVNFLLLPLSLIVVSLFAFPYITRLWKDLFLLAQRLLRFPGDVQINAIEILPSYYLDIPSYTMNAAWPTTDVMITTGLLMLVLLLVSRLLPERLTPLAYLLRVLCCIQLAALAYFAFASEPFAYNLAAYTEGLLRAGVITIMLIPLLFTVTLYMFRMALAKKLLLTAITMGHLTIFIPLQTLVHAYVIHACSFVVMSVMFFMFGLILDILIIIAFYSWGMSWVDITKQ
jgi:hypothetical protein